jgi:uncharacterized protein YkwD
MRRTTVAVFISLAIVATVFAATAPAASAKLTRLERQVVRLVNQERQAYGLTPLRAQASLVRAARSHSRAMAQVPFFSHVSPGGSTPSDRAQASGYSTRGCRRWCVGEAIAWGTGELATAESIVRGWMKSSCHRRILLTTAFRDVGVGTARGTFGSRSYLVGNAVYFTIDFGARQR